MPKAFTREFQYRRELRRTFRKIGLLRAHVKPRPHQLPQQLIINVTSYPPRFRSLHLTLESLLNQTVAADKIILWLAEHDLPHLPGSVRRLVKDDRFSVCTTEDLRSYKKLVPALKLYPEAFLAIADDDVFYPPTWLEELILTWFRHKGGSKSTITCHRAHRFPKLDAAGALPRYLDWEWDIPGDVAGSACEDLIPTGVGGVLYPPGSISSAALDADDFMSLAPTADDLWFYWMARSVGSVYAKTEGLFQLLAWPGTKDTGLAVINASKHGSANDEQLASLLNRLGYPGAHTSPPNSSTEN